MEGRGRRKKETQQPGLSLCHKLAGLPASKCSKLQIWMIAKLCHLLCRDEAGGDRYYTSNSLQFSIENEFQR